MSISAKLTRQLKRLERFKTRRGLGFATVQMKIEVNGPRVQSALQEWERNVLFRIGGYGRKVIQHSMKRAPKRKPARRGGRPPFYRSGLLRRFVLFDVDLRESTVSFGVTRFSSTTKTRKGVPRLLEEGGSATVLIPTRSGQNWTVRRVRARFVPHPYIEPAKGPILRQAAKIMEEEEP